MYWNLVDIKNDLTRGARRRVAPPLGARRGGGGGIAYAVTRPWIELT